MKLRTLVVEDQDYQAEAIKHILVELGKTKQEELGLDGIEIYFANCAATARRRLAQAANEKKPFDILLLDLGLPENPGENDKPDVGVDLLKLARGEDAARGITVISVFEDLDRYVLLAADDFIAKPYSKDELLNRTLKVWKEVRVKHCRKTVNEIMKASLSKLALYADKGLSYRLGSCFSRLAQSVRHETDEIRSQLFKQLNVASTGELPSPLIRHLMTVEDSIKDAREEWKQIQSPFKVADFAPATVIVEDELKQLAERLHPCLAVRLEPAGDHQTRILSFKDSVQNNAPMILNELLVSGLNEVAESDYSKPWVVKVEVRIDDGMAEIAFTDNFKPISPGMAKQINSGDNIAPRDGQWRAWGLSVVQHIALRGGGRLIVQPLEDGNLITYRVTLAQDV
ncbi:MAG: response regulator [Acidobacteriota bacterium]|nr:response regulator [Acidobacteriota bacterium]